jgi:hypothetical protein
LGEGLVGQLDDVLLLLDSSSVREAPPGAALRSPFAVYSGGMTDHVAYWSFNVDPDDATSISVSSIKQEFRLTAKVLLFCVIGCRRRIVEYCWP